MGTKETTCENEELAKTMVKAGILRGIVSCPEHGHHNPYDMYKKEKELEPSTPPEPLIGG